VRVKSRLPFFAYRASVPIVECVNKYDMVGELCDVGDGLGSDGKGDGSVPIEKH
jgi:hypothetical protein